MAAKIKLFVLAVCVAAHLDVTLGLLCASAHWGHPIEGEFGPLGPVQIPAGVTDYTAGIVLPIGCNISGVRFEVCDELHSPKLLVLDREHVVIHRTGTIEKPLLLIPVYQCDPNDPYPGPAQTTTQAPWLQESRLIAIPVQQ